MEALYSFFYNHKIINYFGRRLWSADKKAVLNAVKVLILKKFDV